ncbi:MAG TPA: hypothetical protein VNU46_07735 [Gemmatimonadaceae bacterium]|nr:hypothetical protein [Gemmatimonadaceae bacterium]
MQTSSMKKPSIQPIAGEPIGIIISRGSREEPTPTFSAYIWGPAPDAASETSRAA